MKNSVLALLVLCLTSVASASEDPAFHLLDSGALDFAAPVIYGKTNLKEATAGTIVFDSSLGAFFGLVPSQDPTVSASWLQLGASTSSGTPNVTSTSTGNEHVERAAIQCTGSGCNFVSGSYTPGFSSVTRTGLGLGSITFSNGTFNAIPVCVMAINNWGGQGMTCGVLPSSSTGATFGCLNGTSAFDQNFSVICMGSH